jgi:hypothetical protein
VKSQGLRDAAWLLGAGVTVATALVLVAFISTPEPPPRMVLPTASELVELEPYLDPAAVELVEEPGVSPPVLMEGDPFEVSSGSGGWADPSGEGGAGVEHGAGGADAERATPRWTLSAVLISGDRRSAIVNDRVVRPGDRLNDGTRVEVVEGDHVVIVTPDGVRRRLELERQGS